MNKEEPTVPLRPENKLDREFNQVITFICENFL